MKNKYLWRAIALVNNRMSGFPPVVVWAIGVADGLILGVISFAVGVWIVQ